MVLAFLRVIRKSLNPSKFNVPKIFFLTIVPINPLGLGCLPDGLSANRFR